MAFQNLRSVRVETASARSWNGLSLDRQDVDREFIVETYLI